MSLQRCSARVLRTYPLGETSLIAVLFSDEHGLLRATAKGARSPGSRLRGLLEPGTPVTAVLYLKPRGLHLIKELSLRGAPPRACRDLRTLSLRLAALEIVALTCPEGEPLPGLGALLDDFLEPLAAGGDEDFAPFFAFEAALLALHGLSLGGGGCGQCGRPLAPHALHFLPGEGLLACPDCGRAGFALASEEADWLESVLTLRPSALGGRLMPDAARRQLGRVLHLALSRHLAGYRLPRSLAVLKLIKTAEDAGTQGG